MAVDSEVPLLAVESPGADSVTDVSLSEAGVPFSLLPVPPEMLGGV